MGKHIEITQEHRAILLRFFELIHEKSSNGLLIDTSLRIELQKLKMPWYAFMPGVIRTTGIIKTSKDGHHRPIAIWSTPVKPNIEQVSEILKRTKLHARESMNKSATKKIVQNDPINTYLEAIDKRILELEAQIQDLKSRAAVLNDLKSGTLPPL